MDDQTETHNPGSVSDNILWQTQICHIRKCLATIGSVHPDHRSHPQLLFRPYQLLVVCERILGRSLLRSEPKEIPPYIQMLWSAYEDPTFATLSPSIMEVIQTIQWEVDEDTPDPNADIILDDLPAGLFVPLEELRCIPHIATYLRKHPNFGAIPPDVYDSPSRMIAKLSHDATRRENLSQQKMLEKRDRVAAIIKEIEELDQIILAKKSESPSAGGKAKQGAN
ncbi:hypothetical protein PLICRDRAFT_180749 [Plicaturopsis crispa FD-325 SS-3]|uniref:Uncharacterized protein n=1 Tax=Plicaturopsis crispa FD-325 SS-3 TaxID=944288 RepID=A0A0C9T4P3_PLICR|nr:hypothetical protein PLICRDRAFT_180749 [Plicaturopsis crispa FD-325 SS-3]